ncbi:MAG: hypothetical protein OEM58_05345 [Nitrospirota bacterium]|nr:hypothetical protein [Nitrospirota bacterium]
MEIQRVQTTRFSSWKAHAGVFLIACVLILELLPIFGVSEDKRVWANAHASEDFSRPTWVVDPTNPGEDTPPVGRSLFDLLVSRQDGEHLIYDVPFPFSALLKKIETTVGSERSSSLFTVLLVPFGRSLQRHAAQPDFFRFPRVLATVATEAETDTTFPSLYLKDRLFLAYQEKAAIVEVISYNEAAGRFEFQIVRNFQPGTSPEVLYANRKVCTVCHQNHAPIFPDPLWNETNANPAIHAFLQSAQSPFSSLPHGVDMASAFDVATDRANELLAYDKLWQEGCDAPVFPLQSIECRGNLFIRALQQRLSGSSPLLTRSSSQQYALLSPLPQLWKARWPHGLWIPNPNIPNRVLADFLPTIAPEASGLSPSLRPMNSHAFLHPLMDPATPRPALTTWTFSPPDDTFPLIQVMTGLSNLFSAADIQQLDQQLVNLGQQQHRPAMDFHSDCHTSIHTNSESGVHLKMQCHPSPTSQVEPGQSFSLTGRVSFDQGQFQTGTLSHLQIGQGEDHAHVTIQDASFREEGTRGLLTLRMTQSPSGLHARTNDGNLIQSIDLTWDMPLTETGVSQESTVVSRGTLKTLSDFSLVQEAVQTMQEETLKWQTDVLGHVPFRRGKLLATLFQYLGLPEGTWCCESQANFPPVVLEAHPSHINIADSTDTLSTPFHLLDKYCGDCHHGVDPAPPNFLHGSIDQIGENLAQCAERMYVRLSMWDVAPAQRGLSPMPPATALPRLTTGSSHWPQQEEARLLKQYFLKLLEEQGKSPPSIADLNPPRYDGLSQCLSPSNLMVPDSPSS